MTVAELIALLETIEDKTKKVYTQGCDCWGIPIDIALDKASYSDEEAAVLIITK